MIRTTPVSCNLCDNDNATFLFKAKDRLHGIEGEFSYVQCNGCGLIYMNPQVVPEDIGKLYPTDYGPHCHVTGTSNRSGVMYWLGKHLMNMAKIKKAVYNSLSRESKVLDVGCGQGAVLNDIRMDTGCQVYGVDISENAAKSAKKLYGIDVFQGDIADAPWPDSYFDLITGWQYLEHLNSPHQTIEKMARLLKDTGWLVLATPNFDSLNSKCFKSKWYPLDCPRHLCLWTPKTIIALMLKHGLDVVDIVHDATPWGLTHSLRYFFYDNSANAKNHDRVFDTRLMRTALLPWMRFLSLIKQSDGMIIYAQKKTNAVIACGF
jgi:2-polyprenyl-3-methyl-5-hydroxy-6-metoxy-1,4-benzoquinol methylase